MARSRNIKPGFFINDSLAEVDPIGRLLFAGLWCIADRAGRLEDRPKRIRAEVLPYDDCNVDQLLSQLATRGFVLRYEVAGEHYIQIANFTKHQNPHKNEAPSTIPAPEQSGAVPITPGPSPEDSGTSTVQALDEHSTNRADSLLLIPDSLNMIPDTSSDADVDAPLQPEDDSDEGGERFGTSSSPYKLAVRLRSWILRNLPGAKVPKDDPKSIQNWSIEIDRMMRLDHRDPKQIRAVIDWCQCDPFWLGNILSAGALRKHWDKLVHQMQRGGGTRGVNGQHSVEGHEAAVGDSHSLGRAKASKADALAGFRRAEE